MNLYSLIDSLRTHTAELHKPLPLTWHIAPVAPANPAQATLDESWPLWEPGTSPSLVKNAPNWFYTEFTLPTEKDGVALAGTEAQLFMQGWAPFTLWINGVEQFKESHSWHATGPIVEPFPETIVPGATYRLALCIEPTELPAGFNPVSIDVRPLACTAVAVQLGAALAQLQLAETLVETEEERALLERAVAGFDEVALNGQQWDAVLAAIAEMEAILAPLSPRAKAITMHLIGHAHIDMDWMWTWKDTEYCIRRDFKAASDLMLDYPAVTFTHSQVPTYQVVEEKDPDIFARVQQLIAEGRWENAAGTWVEGDLNMADGESVARHMLYATDWTKAHLHSQAKVVWEPDTFGHPGNMPQLARLGEFDCYFHMRGNPGKDRNWPMRTWIGIDGTSITAFSTEYNGSLHPEALMQNCLASRALGFRNGLHMWGWGDHGGAISRFQLDILAQYQDKPLIPTLTFSTMANLLAAIREEGTALPVSNGPTFNLFEGCFTTHASIKRYNRLCEGALLTAEAACALAGLNHNDILRDAWTKTLFSHFHDIMDGAAVHDSYINAHQRAEAALATAKQATDEALSLLASPSADGRTLVLVNQLGFARSEPVRVALPADTRALRDAEGRLIPVQPIDGEFLFIATLPAFTSVSYQVVTDAVSFPAIAVREDETYFTVETEHATSQVVKTSGAIGSYYDKQLDRELVGFGVPKPISHVPATRADLALNVFQVLDEAPNPMSAWLVNDILREENLLRGAEVKLLESGPVFARLRVKHAFRSSAIEEDIIYYREFPRVDFLAQIDWRERGNEEVGVPQLKVSFGTALTAARLRCEGPFAITEHPADGLDYPSQKWVDLTGEDAGFVLLNDSKYGFDALGGRLRMTLLRNPYGPDPEPDNGHHTVRFAFLPHGADMPGQTLVAQGISFNRLPLAVRTDTVPALAIPQLRFLESGSVVCTALRLAEHSSKLLIRFFEANGMPSQVRFTLGNGITAAEEVNFLENPTGEKVTVADGTVTATFHPYEVKTILLEVKR